MQSVTVRRFVLQYVEASGRLSVMFLEMTQGERKGEMK